MSALFSTRAEMVDAFEALAAKHYEMLSVDRRLQWRKNLLKTYIVEVDRIPDAELGECLRRMIASAWPSHSVMPTDDASLFQILGSDASFMVDMVADRFWLFHSVDAADVADAAVLGTLVQTAAADSMWLPSDFLHDLLAVEVPRGFSTSFDSDYFRRRSWGEYEGSWRYAGPSDEEADELDTLEDEAPLETLSLRMSGTQASLMLEAVESVEDLRQHLTVSRAKIRHGEESTALVEVGFDGRALCRGPDYLQYMDLLRRILDPYSRWLQRVASDCTFRVLGEGPRGLSLDGEPIVIKFPQPVPQAEAFYARLLSGARPFRLWGKPERQSEGYWSGTVCDLHGGGVLRMDLGEEYIRVYLQDGCCANTVLRLVTNLQRAFSSQMEMRAAGEDLMLRYRGDRSDVY